MKLLLLCVAAAFAVFLAFSAKFKLHTLDYNSKRKTDNALIILVTGVVVIIAFRIFSLLNKDAIPYPFEKNVIYYNPYEQLFDALMKHQLNLDVKPAQELAQMANPYDWDARRQLGVSYLWDRAYYNGNYYCYFGIAPVLTVYFPYYFLTKCVPSPHTVCFILSVFSIVTVTLLTVKTHKLFIKKPNLILLLASVLTVQMGSLVLMVQASADFYYTAVQSGILFLALFLLCILCAYGHKSVKKKCVFFALSAVFIVLTVLSRPNLALFGLMAVPVFLNTLLLKKYSVKKKMYAVLSFAVPVCIGAAFAMWYNYARFDSVFEFGANYQLTVHDVREYALSTKLIKPTVYYYFLIQPELKSAFPFIKLSFENIIRESGYKGYVYLTSTVGAFSLPCNWAILASGPMAAAEKNKVKTGFILIGAVCVFAIAFTDMCLGGVNIRYLADIMLVLTLLSTLVLSQLFTELSDNGIIKFVSFTAALIILLVSAAVGAMLIFCNERNYILDTLNGVI